MNLRTRFGITVALAATLVTPTMAQGDRQSTKNEWRNIAIASGVLATIGILKKDKTLTFAGAAGALYSLYRYEQDRKSQNRENYSRAAYFSRPYFVRDGVRYDRRIVNQNGQRYYQFVRHDNGRHLGWDKGKGNPHGGGWNDKDDRGGWNDRNRKNDDDHKNKGNSGKNKSKSKGKGKGGGHN